MREIKFRAWDRITKTMRTMDNPNYTTTGPGWKTKYFGDLQWFFSDFVGDFELMQYTGLKDKKGKDIYEGDIVKWNPWRSGNEDAWHNGQIMWHEQGKWCIKENYINTPIGVYHRIEVIGNIYENPELLKPHQESQE